MDRETLFIILLHLIIRTLPDLLPELVRERINCLLISDLNEYF